VNSSFSSAGNAATKLLSSAWKRSERAKPRGGFTIVELLIVITIIAVVLTISIGLIGNTLQAARRDATRATIKKIDALMKDRIEAFGRLKLDQQTDAASIYFNGSTPGNTVGDGLAAILAHKVAFQGLLPQRTADTYGLDQVSGTTTVSGTPVGLDAPIATLIAQKVASGEFITANHLQATESSELLYMALIEDTQVGNSAAGSATFTSAEVGDTDNDGLKEFIDGWGLPLQFYRWPTRLVRPSPTGASTTAQALLNVGTATEQYSLWINPTFSGAGFPSIDGVGGGVLTGPLAPPPPGGTRGAGTLRSVDVIDPLGIDPEDQLGVFASWIYTTPGGPITDPNGNLVDESRFHTPETHSLPLVVSSGPDRVLGLYMPFDTANFGHLAQPVFEDANSNGALDNGEDLNGNLVLDENGLLDNITNRNLRAGGN